MKNKKLSCFIMALSMLAMTVSTGCGDNSDTETSSVSSESTVETTATTTEEIPDEISGNTEDTPAESQGTPIKINDYYTQKDAFGDDIVVVEYEFYNNNTEDLSFGYTFETMAYQNGEECYQDNSFNVDMELQEAKDKKIQSGESIIVKYGYTLNDTSDVSIEIRERSSNAVCFTETITLP